MDQEGIDAAKALLRRAGCVTPKAAVGGWRAGVRVRMWEDDDARFRSGQ